MPTRGESKRLVNYQKSGNRKDCGWGGKMKDPMLLAFAKDMLGMSDEDVAKVTPEMEQSFKNAMENMAKYRLVAEAIKSKYCTAGIKAGQKIVYNGVLLDTAESTCPLCSGALGPLNRCMTVYVDRCMSNRDLLAPMEGVACADPGMEAGGVGTVVFKVRVEPV
jgi:hypothetical protein